MRAITRCPACLTQFFVSEDQLKKHDGKVRCGQCLHVFDAKTQFITANTAEEINLIDTAVTAAPENLTSEAPPAISTVAHAAPADADLNPDVMTEPVESSHSAPAPTANLTTPEWPLINDILDEDDRKNLAALDQVQTDQEPIADKYELSVAPEDIQAFATENHNPVIDDANTSIHFKEDDDIVDNAHFEDNQKQLDAAIISNLNDITRLTLIADKQTNYFDDLANNKTVPTPKNKKPHRWPWILGIFMLLLIAIAQSIYFLRDDIAIYYPNLKPYLVKACQQLNCNVNLPKQIDLIVIDDSDMQEDINLASLMHFSCSLFNQAPFTQAYPNLELTLTDVEDKPTLRRVFKPNEYLPSNTNVALGFKAGEEIKIKLGITTQGIPVAGYRVFVTY